MGGHSVFRSGHAIALEDGEMMGFDIIDIGIILGLFLVVIFLASVLWRLHSAVDTISKVRRYH